MNRKCETCGRFLKGGTNCKVHGTVREVQAEDLFSHDNEILSADAAAYHLGRAAKLELFIEFKTGMARTNGKWSRSILTHKDTDTVRRNIERGIKYRLKPAPIPAKKAEAPKAAEPTARKNLEDLTTAEIEQRMTEAAEVMTKFGTATKLPSGKTIVIMEVD